MEKKNTKELILEAALDLFSQRGYDGVGVSEIAAAVGIKGSALYNHFKGKEEILSRLIDMVETHYNAHISSFGTAVAVPDTPQELIRTCMAQLDFTMNDPKILKIRRLLTMEQFRNEKLATIATCHFSTSVEAIYTTAFEHLLAKGVMQGGTAPELAFAFTAPITLMIQLCDREPDKKETAMKKIEDHIALFMRSYCLDAV